MKNLSLQTGRASGIFGLVLVLSVVLIALGYSGLHFWTQG
ncbi:hypothetical protein, partial [Mycobacterium tuberculosis]